MTAKIITSRDKRFNLNTVLIIAVSVLALVSAYNCVLFYLAPLRTIPTDMKGLQSDVHDMQTVQAVQSQALATLAKVAQESQEIRTSLSGYVAESSAYQRETSRELLSIAHRLERLESK